VQLQSQQSRFESMDIAIVAVSQEEVDLSKAPEMAAKTGAEFPVVHDLKHELAPQFDRTNAYFIDAQGVVRQIFPMSSYMRPSMSLVFQEIKATLIADEKAAREAGEG